MFEQIELNSINRSKMWNGPFKTDVYNVTFMSKSPKQFSRDEKFKTAKATERNSELSDR